MTWMIKHLYFYAAFRSAWGLFISYVKFWWNCNHKKGCYWRLIIGISCLKWKKIKCKLLEKQPLKPLNEKLNFFKIHTRDLIFKHTIVAKISKFKLDFFHKTVMYSTCPQNFPFPIFKIEIDKICKNTKLHHKNLKI